MPFSSSSSIQKKRQIITPDSSSASADNKIFCSKLVAHFELLLRTVASSQDDRMIQKSFYKQVKNFIEKNDEQSAAIDESVLTLFIRSLIKTDSEKSFGYTMVYFLKALETLLLKIYGPGLTWELSEMMAWISFETSLESLAEQTPHIVEQMMALVSTNKLTEPGTQYGLSTCTGNSGYERNVEKQSTKRQRCDDRSFDNNTISTSTSTSTSSSSSGDYVLSQSASSGAENNDVEPDDEEIRIIAFRIVEIAKYSNGFWNTKWFRIQRQFTDMQSTHVKNRVIDQILHNYKSQSSNTNVRTSPNLFNKNRAYIPYYVLAILGDKPDKKELLMKYARDYISAKKMKLQLGSPLAFLIRLQEVELLDVYVKHCLQYNQLQLRISLRDLFSDKKAIDIESLLDYQKECYAYFLAKTNDLSFEKMELFEKNKEKIIEIINSISKLNNNASDIADVTSHGELALPGVSLGAFYGSGASSSSSETDYDNEAFRSIARQIVHLSKSSRTTKWSEIQAIFDNTSSGKKTDLITLVLDEQKKHKKTPGLMNHRLNLMKEGKRGSVSELPVYVLHLFAKSETRKEEVMATLPLCYNNAILVESFGSPISWLIRFGDATLLKEYVESAYANNYHKNLAKQIIIWQKRVESRLGIKSIYTLIEEERNKAINKAGAHSEPHQEEIDSINVKFDTICEIIDDIFDKCITPSPDVFQESEEAGSTSESNDYNHSNDVGLSH